MIYGVNASTIRTMSKTITIAVAVAGTGAAGIIFAVGFHGDVMQVPLHSHRMSNCETSRRFF